MRCLTKTCRAVTAACLLLAASAAGAATPAAADDALAALQAAYVRAVAPGEQADSYRDLFATVFQRVQRSHAKEVDPSGLAAAALKVVETLAPGAGDPAVVFRNAVNAALRTLDPYSRYLDPRAQSAERSSLSGSFGGLGLELETSDGVIRVVTSLPGSPAERAGMQPGDLILGVDDQPLQGIPLTDAIARLRGQPGTPVAITIRRTGVPDEFKVSVTRDTIRRQIVRWTLEGEVLVLRIGSFMGAVAAPLEQAITEAMAGHAPRAVVLDMRGNPGGLVREAVLTADAFLAKGEIVSLRGRTPGSQRNWQADASELLPGLPMLVLIDGRSASAAELVAA
ncbi:MAG TPA: S41 family peptidase, partial [Ramlibacter sp.]|nr:S41 family peptidase [Ramlibacter sp.]